MQTPRFRFTFLSALVIASLGIGAAVGFALSSSQRAAEPIVRNGLGVAEKPRGAKGRTLGLSKVVIQPGGGTGYHYHQGTQIAYINRGKITYEVVEGKVKVRTGPAEDSEVVRTIAAGEKGPLKQGEWIVEQPSDKHEAFNRGKKKVVIYSATLLKSGAPPATPIE